MKKTLLPFYIITALFLWYLQSQLIISLILFKVVLSYILYSLWKDADQLLSPWINEALFNKIKPYFKGLTLIGFLFTVIVHLLPYLSTMVNSTEKYNRAKTNNAINWMTKEDLANVQAYKENKPLIIDFFADWCMPCKQMEINTFSDKAVQETINKNYIALKIDVSKPSTQSNQLMNAYGVKSFPTLILIDQNTKKQKKLVGYIDAYQLKQALSSFK